MLAERNKDIIDKFLNKIVEGIKASQVSQGRVTSGKSLQAWEVRSTEFSGQILGASYAFTLETGRKGGKVPRSFREIIFEWMKSKSIFQAESIRGQKSIAYFIAKKIAEKGTKLHIDGGRSGILTDNLKETEIKEFEALLAKNVNFEYQSVILKAFAKDK